VFFFPGYTHTAYTHEMHLTPWALIALALAAAWLLARPRSKLEAFRPWPTPVNDLPRRVTPRAITPRAITPRATTPAPMPTMPMPDPTGRVPRRFTPAPTPAPTLPDPTGRAPRRFTPTLPEPAGAYAFSVSRAGGSLPPQTWRYDFSQRVASRGIESVLGSLVRRLAWLNLVRGPEDPKTALAAVKALAITYVSVQSRWLEQVQAGASEIVARFEKATGSKYELTTGPRFGGRAPSA